MPTKVTSQQPQSLHATRTYVLDTSVLLADPGALKRFAEHEVVLPVVVITEKPAFHTRLAVSATCSTTADARFSGSK